MSVGLLVVSHHNIGSALIEAVDTSFAHQLPLKVENVDVAADADTDTLIPQVKAAVKKLDSGDGVLILTDLYGSTPANICREAFRIAKVKIVTGLNLPMLLRVLNYPQLSLEEMAANAVTGGQSGILSCGPDDAKE